MATYVMYFFPTHYSHLCMQFLKYASPSMLQTGLATINVDLWWKWSVKYNFMCIFHTIIPTSLSPLHAWVLNNMGLQASLWLSVLYYILHTSLLHHAASSYALVYCIHLCFTMLPVCQYSILAQMIMQQTSYYILARAIHHNSGQCLMYSPCTHAITSASMLQCVLVS